MTSQRCIDGMYWDRDQHNCLHCEGKYAKYAGYEFTENCGWSDDQQQIDSPYSPCRDGTFNDGFHVKCQKCLTCTTPQFIACSATSDTICCKRRAVVFNGSCVSRPLQTTVVTTSSETSIITDSSTSTDSSSPTSSPTSSLTSVQSPIQSPPHAINVTGIYVCLGILSVLTLVCLIFVIKRRKTNQLNEEFHKLNGEAQEILSKKAINRNENTTVSYNIIGEVDNDHFTGSAVLLADVQGAPLKTVLNNLDVLEELVLVLDPDTTGAKNTRHLAAQCSFSFAWINYAYSMKDHKSPFVAVLEGVVTKNPDWTVGHLAELLTAIGRNDAVEILAKLPAGVEE